MKNKFSTFNFRMEGFQCMKLTMEYKIIVATKVCVSVQLQPNDLWTVLCVW